LAFLNTRIAGSRDIPLSLVVHIVPNARNAIVFIKLNITEKWYDIVRLTSK